MAREDVNIKVSANVAEAIRLWKSMEEGPQGMANELDALGRKGKRSADDMSTAMDKLIGKWATLGAKIQGVKSLYNEWSAFNAGEQGKVDSASMMLDVASRRFQVQAGVSDSQMSSMRSQILGIAKARGVGIEAAFGVGQQLLSSGFKTSDVLGGGALDAALQAANALNATGKNFNPTEFAASLGNYLEGTGQKQNAGNLRALSQQLYGLYLGTDVQPQDLAQLASKASAIQSMTGMSQGDILGVYSQFRGTLDAATAATAMRSGYVAQATIGADKGKTAALATMGLKPGDVDYVNESHLQVQERMIRGFASLSDDMRNRVAKTLYGQEGLPFYTTLMSDAGMRQTRERLGMSSDLASFNRSAAITEGGLAADEARAEVETAQAYATGTPTSATVKSRFLARLRREGAWGTTRALAATGYDMAIGWGFSPSEAVDFAMPGWAPGRAVGSPSEARQIKEDVTQATTVRVELVDQNQIAIPHKSAVNGLSRPNRGVGGAADAYRRGR
jgi:hypothetical protein